MHQDSIVNLLTNPLKLSPDVKLETIDGGAVNRTFKLSDNDRAFAVKWFADDAFSGINRLHQFVLQEQLAHRKIAPMPVWLSDDGKLWVEVWHEAAQLPADPNQQINTLANVLSTIHAQPITARPLELTQRFEHYIKIANISSDDSLTHQANEIAKWLLQESDDTALTLCHNDLAMVHILDPALPVVIDWEYAAMGNRYFDIASAIEINQLANDDALVLCELYAERASLDKRHVKESVDKQLEVVQLTNILWKKALDYTNKDQIEPPIVL
ncbi:phosphotransferase [Alteromonas sp. ASW11-130]|uniref:phosphotransferase n=1 Tax=Alteromonas sp. ASW11-130 TaxID=3015775 RepID=UPI0022418D3E|nr:phosphotransferase [Alteromonas sp. ASW11-130]MCW8093136.1 phosphotransferase [Alteromonas sp. ASW11-130]